MMEEFDAVAGWRELAVYPTRSSAEVDAAYLRSEGVQAWVISGLPTEACGVQLMVDGDSLDRARWLLKFEPVTEAELEFLATGKLPEQEREA